jgi:hypothetical protein
LHSYLCNHYSKTLKWVVGYGVKVIMLELLVQ